MRIGSSACQMTISQLLFVPRSIDGESKMAFAAKQFGSRVANPQSVLHHIGSLPVDLSEETLASALDAEAAPVGLKIFQPQETTLEAEQARQLGQHLVRWRAELEAAQADFEDQQRAWYLQREVEQQEIALRHKTLQQRERQVRSLEGQLLQLQNDVIDGQTALQSVAEQLSADGFLHVMDEEKISALEDLRFEISERFDYLVERWVRFRESQSR